MATKSDYVTSGYGQVEPNRLSGQKGGLLLADLPLDSTNSSSPLTQIENGQYAKYDEAEGVINLTGPGDWFMCFSEPKTYGEFETTKDFVITADSALDGKACPRLIPINMGDAYTTNFIKKGTYTPAAKQYLTINTDGVPEIKGTSLPSGSDMVLQIVKVYTLPDGQAAVKLMRVR